MNQAPGNDGGGEQADAAVEAARYALLRRLAPSMRHHLVVNLQPISMIYEVLDRRLQAAQPNLAQIHDSASKINGFAKAALVSSLDVVTWLAPTADTCSLHDGVRECVGLVASSFSFRGFAVRNELAGPTAALRVSRAALRHVLTSALVAASDSTAAPAEFVLTAGASGMPELVLEVRPNQGEGALPAEPGYRALAWPDVAALAGAEGVSLQREGQRVILGFTPAP